MGCNVEQVTELTKVMIHVFVQIDRNTQKKIDFSSDQVTGTDIKREAGVPLEDDLSRRNGQKLDLVTNSETISIKNGDHFVVFPPGTIS